MLDPFELLLVLPIAILATYAVWFAIQLYVLIKLNIELKRRELEAWDLDDEEETEEEEEDDDGEAWKKG